MHSIPNLYLCVFDLVEDDDEDQERWNKDFLDRPPKPPPSKRKQLAPPIPSQEKIHQRFHSVKSILLSLNNKHILMQQQPQQ